jgi:hypothetical protein
VLAHAPSQNEDEVARRVEARMLRQQILTGEHAPSLHVVIDAGALHRAIGGPEVMYAQLGRLAEAARRPNVTVQVLPFSAGAYTPMEGGFIVLRFADDEGGDIVSVDLLARSLYVDDPREVARYRDAWENVLATAASPADSLNMITAAAERMTS